MQRKGCGTEDSGRFGSSDVAKLEAEMRDAAKKFEFENRAQDARWKTVPHYADFVLNDGIGVRGD
jgi:hypothetical protein